MGNSLRLGEVLTLLEGIAELDFENAQGGSMRVRIEGPASVFLRADGKIGVRHGTVTADARPKGGEFSLETPAGAIQVLADASFGIRATEDSHEIHAFDGELIVTPGRGTLSTEGMRVSRGNALRLQLRFKEIVGAEHIAASPAAFASSRSMLSDRVRFGKAYQDIVLRSEPVVYLRFAQASRVVPNLGSAEGLDLHQVGEVHWRTATDQATVEFGLNPNPGCFVSQDYWPNEPLGSYSIEFWMKPSQYRNGSLVSLVGKDPQGTMYPHGLLVELGGPVVSADRGVPSSAIRFLHRNPLSLRGDVGTSCISSSNYRVRQWQHIAVTKDGQKMTLYLDGKVMAEAHELRNLPGQLRLVVGQIYPLDGSENYNTKGIRPYIGQVRELAAYERPLEASEIRARLRSARPDTKGLTET
ncbi:LamG domain-containing protein [Posidoniimonas corsicana]|uniref:LamG domain-containing protein n=1 Tax=Posidoniimonas corsicana TaxID=1938618 RepID=UPI001E4E7326|nr:LamG domain-containing protein [Posidoniimonas corsicana]